MEELYNKHKKLIYKICSKYTDENHTIDDLMQESYFALVKAIDAYGASDKTCVFTTYLVKSLEWHFIRLKSKKYNSNEICVLDSPVSNQADGEATNADFLVDEDAEFEDDVIEDYDKGKIFDVAKEIIENERKSQVDKSIDYAEPLILHYKYGLTYKQISECLSIGNGTAEQRVKKALKTLKRHSHHGKLAEYYENYISGSYRHNSLNHFRNSGLSSVEWAVNKIMNYENRETEGKKYRR